MSGRLGRLVLFTNLTCEESPSTVAKFLFKLGRWSFHRKWIVILLWLVTLAGVAGAAVAFQKPFSNEFSIGGTPAIEATKVLVQKFPEGGNPVNAASVNVVFAAPEGEQGLVRASRVEPRDVEQPPQPVDGLLRRSLPLRGRVSRIITPPRPRASAAAPARHPCGTDA